MYHDQTLRDQPISTLGPPDHLLDRLHARSRAADWHLSVGEFRAALDRSLTRFFRDGNPTALAIEQYLESLHLSDLALACACEKGDETAWEYFVREFRPALYAAGGAIAGSAAGRELADSLYGDLFGLDEKDGRRRSLFRYYDGRSKLGTWLRAVLGQRHVDAYRSSRRFQPLEDAEVQSAAPARAGPPDPDRRRYLAAMQTELTAALRELEPRESLHLTYYYVDDLTLAQIGRLFGEHESTVSRKLERTRRALRQQIEQKLRERHRLKNDEIELCYAYAREEWPFDLQAVLPSGSDA